MHFKEIPTNIIHEKEDLQEILLTKKSVAKEVKCLLCSINSFPKVAVCTKNGRVSASNLSYFNIDFLFKNIDRV